MRTNQIRGFYVAMVCGLCSTIFITPLEGMVALSDASSGIAHFFKQAQDLISTQQPVALANFPLIKDFSLPPALYNMLLGARLEKTDLRITDNEVRLSGEVTLFGIPLKAYIVHVRKGTAKHYDALVIGIPQGWRISDIMTKIFQLPPLEQQITSIKTVKPDFNVQDIIDFEIADGAFAMTNESFEDSYFGKFEMGFNLAATIRLLGLAEPFTKLFGTNLNELRLLGTITPTIEGSSLTATLPGKITLVEGLETTPVSLNLSFEGVSTTLPGVILPGVELKGGFTVYPSFISLLKEPLSFQGVMGVTPTKGKVDAFTQGFLRDVLPGIDIGNLGIGFTVDWVLLMSSGIPISGIGIRGSTQFLQKTVNLAAQATYTSAGGIGDIIFEGSMQGKTSLEEVVLFSLDMIRKQAQLLGLTTDTTIQQGVIPNMVLENPRLIIVPKDGKVAGKKYFRGIELGGAIEILNNRGELDIVVTMQQLKGKGKLTPMVIKNPLDNTNLLEITSAQTKMEGPSVEVNLAPPIFKCYLDGSLFLNILGGISSHALIDLSLRGLSAKFTTKLLGLYESEVEIQAATLQSISADNFSINMRMQQTFFNFLEQEMVNFARSITPKLEQGSTQEHARIEGEIARLDQEIATQMNLCQSAPYNWDQTRCTLFWQEIVRRNIEKAGLIFYRDAIFKPGVAVSTLVTQAFSSLTQVAAYVLAQGITIQSITSTARLAEFTQSGTLPHVTITLKFFGRDVELKDLHLSLSDIPSTIQHIFQELSKLVGEQTSPTPQASTGTVSIGKPVRIK